MVFGVLVLRIASVGNAEVGCTLDLQERNSEVGGPALAKGQRHADLLTLPGDRRVVGAAVIAAGVVLDVELVGHEVAVLVQHHVPVESVQRQHVQVLTVVERPLGVGVHDDQGNRSPPGTRVSRYWVPRYIAFCSENAVLLSSVLFAVRSAVSSVPEEPRTGRDFR